MNPHERGLLVAHTSDPESGLADVGLSVGLGDAALYAGEFAGSTGWGLCLYTREARVDIAHDVHREHAREMIHAICAALSTRTDGEGA